MWRFNELVQGMWHWKMSSEDFIGILRGNLNNYRTQSK